MSHPEMSPTPKETDTRRTYRVIVAHKQALLSLALVTLKYNAYNNEVERMDRGTL